jgi:hypothetical protein
MGKFSHALAAVARPRLENKDNASVIWSKIKVSFNDVDRSITGARRCDHVTIKDLLDLAGIESANRMEVKAIAAETWSCYHSEDGKDGARNHVGTILFTDNKTSTAKTTRSARTGQITVPLRGGTPSSRMRPTCGIGQSSYAPGRRRLLQRRRHQTWKVSPHFSKDLTSRLRLLGCSLRVMGRLPGNVGRLLQEVGRLLVSLSLLHSSPDSCGLSFFLPRTKGN